LPNRPYDLPPANWLVTFEAAARNSSFKSAAAELGVTPAAVSHQVKALEQELNCILFNRFHRGVELTESGAYLFVSLQRGFESINESLSQLRAQHGRSSVTIRSSTAMSSLWLTPRLAEFWKSFGHISVAQIVSDTPLDAGNCDISILYGDMSRETLPCRTLFNDTVTALASPEFAKQHRITTAQELAQLPLIQLVDGQSDWMTWPDLLATLGYTGPMNIKHQVNNYVIALQAARDGMGAVLGWECLTSDLVASGKLCQILPTKVSAQQDFYLKLHNLASDKARRVFDWLSAKA
jgi:DNA-binding transcriptional LysR family regulator